MSDYLPSTTMACCRLPEELMMDILSRLPVKTLVKFQLVSKPWRSLIKSPFFIRMHLNNQGDRDGAGKNDCFIMVRRKAPIRNTTKTDTYTCSNDGLNVCKPTWNPGFCLGHGIGCCDGILCSTFEEDSYLFGWKFLLFNPAIRDYKYVYKPMLEHPRMNAAKMEPMSLVFGFGFDLRANDYKIIRIDQYEVEQAVQPNEDFYEAHMQTQCQVYSRNSDSWRSFEGVIDGVLVENTNTANVSGAIHWLAERGDQHFIVSFDLSYEVLGEIMLPERNNDESFYRDVDVWKDCLAATYYYEDQGQVFEIWSMIKYGVHDSWVKVTTFGCHIECLTFLMDRSSRNGEFLFCDDDTYKIFSYNPRDQEPKEIKVPGGLTDDWVVLTYKESLIIVDGSTKKLEFRSNLELALMPYTWKDFEWCLVTLLVMWIVGHWWPSRFLVGSWWHPVYIAVRNIMLAIWCYFLALMIMVLICTIYQTLMEFDVRFIKWRKLALCMPFR